MQSLRLGPRHRRRWQRLRYALYAKRLKLNQFLARMLRRESHDAATRPFDGLPLNVPLYWGVQPPTPDAQRGFKTCASLVGGEEGEARGGEGIGAITSKQESVNMR